MKEEVQGAAKGAAAGSWLGPAGAIGGALLGGLAGGQQQGMDFKARQYGRDMAYAALNRLGTGNINKMLFGGGISADGTAAPGLLQLMQPYMQSALAGNAMAAQRAAGGAQAGLARAGLGATGLGASLGAGLTAGAAFQNNQLRARMFQDALQSALGIAGQEASVLSGVQMPAQSRQTPLTGAIQGAGSMLTTLDAAGKLGG